MLLVALLVLVVLALLVLLYYARDNDTAETREIPGLVFLHSYFSNEARLFSALIRSGTRQEREDIAIAMEDNDQNLTRSYGHSLSSLLTKQLRRKRRVLSRYIRVLLKVSAQLPSDSDEEDLLEEEERDPSSEDVLSQLSRHNRELTTTLLGETISPVSYSTLFTRLAEYDERLVMLAKSSKKRRALISSREDRQLEESIQGIVLALS